MKYLCKQFGCFGVTETLQNAQSYATKAAAASVAARVGTSLLGHKYMFSVMVAPEAFYTVPEQKRRKSFGESKTEYLIAAKEKDLIITDEIMGHIYNIRTSGATNMLDTAAVQRLANELGFYELVVLIEDNKAAYTNYILTGKRD